MRTFPAIAAIALAACGPIEGSPANDPDAQPTPPAVTALDHTPGYFRDTFRALEAQKLVAAPVAVEQMETDLALRLSAPSELPPLPNESRAMLDALWGLGLRSVQAAKVDPERARRVGELVLTASLGLDPALYAFNEKGGQAQLTQPEPPTLAIVGREAIDIIAAGDASCADTRAIAASSSFDPGPPEVVWVPETCEPERWIDGYCRPDKWIDGACYDVWIPETCEGGEWVDEGYWYYDCYHDDCEYVWVEYWVYYDGDCDGGYWDEDCEPGRWERGICYSGYWIEERCTGGYELAYYPNGSWTFTPIAAPPPSCTYVRPRQFEAARASLEKLNEVFEHELQPRWQRAISDIVTRHGDAPFDEGVYHAMVQVLDAVSSERIDRP